MLEKRRNGFLNNRAQVTIFIIIAIVIVVGVAVFFLVRSSISKSQLPADFEPIYNTFTSCLEQYTLTGADILESQGGYIYLPAYESGSKYAPFSSRLNFVGSEIPYWYYVSGNNIQKQQVPSITNMQDQLSEFLDDKITQCVFDKYTQGGFAIYLGNKTSSKVVIRNNQIEVSMNFDLGIEGRNQTAVISNHNVVVNSQLGALYASAKKVYDYEQQTLFLENYAVDTIRLYAPVDGVEFSCSPKTWNAEDIFDDFENAIETNTLYLKSSGTSYTLNSDANKYFVVDLPVDNDVRFLNSKQWPHSFEVNPSDGAVLVAKPVGNEPSLGALGFCYTAYHFVYDVNYPVLAQVYSEAGDEFFQFPMAVVVRGNMPRKPLESSTTEVGIPDFCLYKNSPTQVNVYDVQLNPLDADISYKCAGTRCQIGQTNDGVLLTNFPQCANGFLTVEADGYKTKRVEYSTSSEGSVDVILDKEYDLDVELNLDNRASEDKALISFIADDGVASTIMYPDTKTVTLSEGQYNVSVQVYKNSSLTFAATTTKQCTDVPQSGLGGLFGLTEKKCFDINMPEQVVSSVLSGGGKQKYYILESELADANTIEINAQSLALPKTIDELQNNYVAFESQGLDIEFK